MREQDPSYSSMLSSLKRKHGVYQTTRNELIDRLGTTIYQFPRIMNRKLANSLHRSPLAHLFNDKHAVLLAQCDVLNAVYTRLNAQLGEETFVGSWHHIDQALIDQFATVTGDQQWLHTDPIRAQQESPFKTTIAHGFLTLALLPVLTESVEPGKTPYPEARMITNCGLNQVVFPYPIKVDKHIRARVRLLALVPMKRSLELVNEITVEIKGSRKSACIAETVARIYF